MPDELYLLRLVDSNLGFTGDPKDLLTSPFMQTLLQMNLIKKTRADRIKEGNYNLGYEEYVNPLASIYHLVSSHATDYREQTSQLNYEQYQTYDVTNVKPRSLYSQAVLSLECKYAGFALDVIRAHDSYGEEVIRYGYYPREAAIQSCKRSASLGQGSRQGSAAVVAGAAGVGGADAGQGRASKMPRRTGPRKMSRSELICCDANLTDKETFVETEDEMETETETEKGKDEAVVVVETETETEDDDDLYN